jgi:NAD(P)-dependent dehydrogenase (short-subunit alcohol dehydrogenase family)
VTPNLPSLVGRTAIVTGAGSGIGRACALSLAAAGAWVAATDIDGVAAGQTADEVCRQGGRAFALTQNIADEESVERATTEVLSRTGAVHIGVSCAAVAARSARLREVDLTDWQRVIDVNLTGSFLTLRSHVAAVADSGGGALVVVGSVLSAVASPSGSAPYVVAKHGLVGLVKQAAVDHAREGVRVNLVLPGYVATPLALARLSEAELDERARRQPLGRLARPDEIADAVTWLSGDGASFITGSSLVVDGGYLAL